MTPFGAQCAIHPAVSAVVTCSRCGNFMCLACSKGLTATLCPTCREASSSTAFPFGASADFGTLWAHAFSAFNREFGMLLVASLIFVGIDVGGTMVGGVLSNIVSAVFGLVGAGSMLSMVVGYVISQVLNLAVGAVVQAFALTGYFRVLVDVLVGRKADVGRMFAFLERMPSMIVVQLVLAFVISAPIMALGGGVGLYELRKAGLSPADLTPTAIIELLPSLVGPLMVVSLVSIVVAIIVLPITLFAVPEMLVGQCSPVEAVTRAWNLGSGQRLRMIGYTFVGGLVMLLGLLACCVGVLAALPVTYLLVLALFLALRNGAGLPAAKFD